jgi:hypothetical protein
MSKMTAKPNAIPKAPKAPTSMLSPSGQKIANTGAKLDRDEGVRGAHSRSEHVGKTGAQLTGRGKQTATTFLSKTDQNKAVAQRLTPGAVKPVPGQPQTKIVKGVMGKTASIARVSEKVPGKPNKVYNAKVTETTVVTQRRDGQTIQTSYPSKMTALPKPAPGPSLKPTTKANVTSIASGASQLRKVPAPVTKGPSLARDNGKGVQKNFGGVMPKGK